MGLIRTLFLFIRTRKRNPVVGSLSVCVSAVSRVYCGDSPGWPFTYISQIGAAWSEPISAVHKTAHKGATHERLDVLLSS